MVEAELGAGQFGVVYRVRHRLLGQQAMKVYRPGVEGGLAEAIVLTRLQHPNLVRAFEANTVDDGGPERVYLTMEYVGGGTLEQLLAERGRLPVAEAVAVARQVSAGLAVAHAESPPVVHRDVWPQNVLLRRAPDGSLTAKLADFGLARPVDRESLMAAPAGALGCMAPEATLGYVSPASDVYSVGVILFRMLTGGAPDGRTPPSRYRVGITPELDALVLRALAPDPGDRFADAGEVERALGAAGVG